MLSGISLVTPRIGKPVEVNALWYNALRAMAAFAQLVGAEAAEYSDLADQAHAGFARFWHARLGHCYDVLDTPRGDDSSLRPNQLFAVALPHSPLAEAQTRVVTVRPRTAHVAWIAEPCAGRPGLPG